MQYNQFVDEINSGRLAKAVVCLRGYPHYRRMVFECCPCLFSPFGVEISIRPVPDGTEDMVCYHRYDESRPVVRIKKRGRLTLRQIWSRISIEELTYHKAEDVVGKGSNLSDLSFSIDRLNYSFSGSKLVNPTMAYQLSICGNLRINIDGERFLDEMVCPIELYMQLKAWQKQIRRGYAVDFVYSSANAPAACIFSIKKGAQNDWRIDSPTGLFPTERTFTTQQIDNGIAEYYYQLERLAVD